MKMPAFCRDALLFFGMIAAVVLFWKNNLLTGAILLVESLLAMIFLYQKTERIFFFTAGIFGVILEIIGSSIGIWIYIYPDLITVPFWIFFCWGFTFQLLYTLHLMVVGISKN